MRHFFVNEFTVIAQAAAQPAIPPVVTNDRWYYLGLALLVVALIVAAITAYRLWFDLSDVPEPDSAEDLLDTFREARAAGELNDQEFERVRRQLGIAARPERKAEPRDLSPP